MRSPLAFFQDPNFTRTL